MQTFKKKNIITLFLLLLLPISLLSLYTIKQYLSKAAGFTFKVTNNHQLTCTEQIDFGNHVIVSVIDESNNPISGISVEYWPDHNYPNGSNGNAPTGVGTTNAQGKFDFNNLWPGCLGACPDGTRDQMVKYFFKIKDQASDTAVEISTGIYGNECAGAGYGDFCPNSDNRNVWGHWAYQITFQKKLEDLAITEVATDHGGQSIVPVDKRSQCKYFDFYNPNVDYNPRRTGNGPTATPTLTPTPTQTNCPDKFDYTATKSAQIKNYCDQNGKNCQTLNKNYPATLLCHGQVGPTPSVPVWGPYGSNCTQPSCECACIDPNATSTPTPITTLTVTPTKTPTVTPTVIPTSTPSPTITPTPTTNLIDIKLNLKLKFQGIISQPSSDEGKMKVKIKLSENNYQTGNFTSDSNGIWTGTVTFNKIIKTNNYSILIKGPKHLQKKFSSPIIAGENNLDFTNTYLMAGDLPDQDGIIDSYDTSLIRNYLGKTDAASLRIADINLDGIVDSQDFSLVITTLTSLKNNIDEQ